MPVGQRIKPDRATLPYGSKVGTPGRGRYTAAASATKFPQRFVEQADVAVFIGCYPLQELVDVRIAQFFSVPAVLLYGRPFQAEQQGSPPAAVFFRRWQPLASYAGTKAGPSRDGATAFFCMPEELPEEEGSLFCGAFRSEGCATPWAAM
jgi:hypothetical protein